jgi:PAS domain S-box-containing protein
MEATELMKRKADQRFGMNKRLDSDRSGKDKGRSIRFEVDYRTLFESSNDGIIVLRGHAIIDVNSRVIEMFGCDRDDLLGKGIRDISPEHQHDGVPTVNRIIEHTEKIANGSPLRFSWLYSRPDSSQFLAESTVTLLNPAPNDLVMLALRDITKEQEMAELFENMYRINPLAMILTDAETGVHIDVNEAYSKIFGYSQEETVGKTTLDLGIWIDPAERRRFIELSTQHGQALGFEAQMRNRKGERISILLNSAVLRHGFRRVLFTMAQDVTRLRQAEISFRNVFEQAPFALGITDLYTGVIIDVNKRLVDMLGYPREEMLGRNGAEFDNFPEDIRLGLYDLLVRYGRFDNVETIFISKSGEKLNIVDSASLIPFEGRTVVLNALQDITTQKRAETALRESEEKFSKLFSANPDFISVSDIETGLFYEANEGLKHLLGYNREEMIGKTSLELGMWVYPEERARFVAEIKKKGEIPGFWIKFRGREGNVFDGTISSKTIDFNGKKCMLNVIKDMTEMVKLEEQLRHSQRMEAIGTLAGGVAHDFNNILTGIEGHIELAKMKLGEDNPAAANLDMVMKLSNKAAQLNHNLLAFSRKQALNREIISIREIIRRSEQLLKRLIGADIEFSVDFDDDAAVNADALQIEQVIINMVVNARDAMPKGGKLTIATEIVDVDEYTAQKYQADRTGNYICVTISDTGVGMTRDVMDRIFDPFFTTKGVGKGTGLGLSMAYGNIRQHGGFISVYSEVGVGSQFRIFLPVVHGESERKKIDTDSVARGGTETILIAEDDDVVRNLDRLFLEKGGYTVLDARDGEEAIRIFTENMGNISMVILDVIMPKKTGKDAFDAIKLLNPSIKVLFISGYTDDYIHERAELGRDIELLLKPVPPRLLLQKVRETLDR